MPCKPQPELICYLPFIPFDGFGARGLSLAHCVKPAKGLTDRACAGCALPPSLPPSLPYLSLSLSLLTLSSYSLSIASGLVSADASGAPSDARGAARASAHGRPGSSRLPASAPCGAARGRSHLRGASARWRRVVRGALTQHGVQV